MPDEPNKKMDEMLRTYARERRKSPEIELHSATRNLLQGEVRRVFGASGAAETKPWWKRLRAFWPQLTFAGSMCVILSVAILSLRQRPVVDESPTMQKQEMEVIQSQDKSDRLQNAGEKREASGEAQTTRGLSAPEAPSPRPEALPPGKNVETLRSLRREPTAADSTRPAQLPEATPQLSQQKREEDGQRVPERALNDAPGRTDSAIAPEVRLQRKSEPVAKAQELKEKESGASDSKLSSANTLTSRRTAVGRSATAGTSPDTVSLADDMTNLGAARRLSFVQVSNVSARGSAPAEANGVLTSFQVEQLGNSVKFLDRDGSVYLGALEATNSASALAVAGDATKLDSAAAYSFRVQGTNRTLGKDVVLVGEYFEQTNPAPSSLDTFSITPTSAARPKLQPRHLIIGNATVGATNQVPVRAVANEP